MTCGDIPDLTGKRIKSSLLDDFRVWLEFEDGSELEINDLGYASNGIDIVYREPIDGTTERKTFRY